MPLKHAWQSRIKAVEREHAAMRLAADYLLQRALDDPNILQSNLRHAEIASALRNLEGTYVIRLFAEFESGARNYWGAKWTSDPKMADLLDGLAARCGIPSMQLDNVHIVRDYRNSLVHEREDEFDVVPIGTARSYLCHFFSYLPPRW